MRDGRDGDGAAGAGGSRTEAVRRIVGIGASAGGIPALKVLFHDLPATTGMAFVVVSHLSVSRESSLAAILQAQTAMPVVQASDGEAVRGDRVYVIAPGHDLTIDAGALRLVAPDAGAGVRAPIDRFFRSMADSYGRTAACVVLSGTGADGTLGLKRVKEHGGLTLVQSPDDAEYDSMPRSAVATGRVDAAAPVAQIARMLVSFASDDPLTVQDEVLRPEVVADTLRDILTLVRVRSGHDFGSYKRATLLRRIGRRMQVCQTETMADYHRYLRDHPPEITGLLRDFLISVTNFFRDPEVFAAIERDIVPRLFTGKKADEAVRMWVPGCATGEEAYSLAMLAAEYAGRMDDPPRIQIFATDMDDEALAEARVGRYPVTIASDLSADRVERFFDQDGHHYRVRDELRDMVLFSPHNLLRDPPFSRLDLVSCRNLLIYLNRDAQDRVLGILHFGLRSGGVLVLGSSESADSATTLFAPIDARHRIFRRRPAASPVLVTASFPAGTWHFDSSLTSARSERPSSFGELHHRLVEYYAPPSLLLDDDLDVVHVSERAGRFLTVAGGEPTRDVMRLIHAGLRLDLRAAIYAARHHPDPGGRAAETRTVGFELDGKQVVVRLTVRILDLPDVGRGLLLVVLDEQDSLEPSLPRPPGPDSTLMEPMVRQLEDEVRRNRDQLRTTVEQYETTVEELKASNEELHAINEELRSATEELETSKEELQSVNEELTTLNSELKDKIDALSRANGDLQNLMSSTDIGVLFLDRALHVKRFTPRVGDVFNIIPSDIGRPLDHVTHRLDCDDLSADAGRVLHDLRTLERSVSSKDGSRYLVRLHPYRSLDDRIDGVVLTFVNVTDLKRAEDALRASDAMLHLAERAADAGIWELDLATQTLRMSDQGFLLYGLEPGVSIELDDWLARVSDLDRTRVATALRLAAVGHSELSIEFRIAQPSSDIRRLWHLGKVIEWHDGHPRRMAGITVDITTQTRVEAALQTSEDRFRLALRTAPVVMLTQDRELRYTWGYMMGGEVDFLGKTDLDLFPPDEAEPLMALKREVMASGLGRRTELALTFGGQLHHYDLNLEPVRSDGGVVGVSTAAVDMTGSKTAELALREADRRKDEFLATLAHELRNPLAPLRTAIDLQKLAGTDLAMIARTREIMDRQVDQIVRLVDDLLDVSRITLGKIRLQLASVDIAAVVAGAVEAVQPLLDRADHQLDVDVPGRPIRVHGDLPRLTQVLTNLLANAIKFTPRGGRIGLSVDTDDQAATVQIHVRDRGVGISAEMLPRVFDMFAQDRDAVSLSQGGLGIGLMLVRRLVEMHDGTVEARSDGADLGSEFVVTLPIRQRAATAGGAEVRLPRPRPSHPRRVLIVDDNPDVTDTISEVLEMIGHVTRQAPDGPTALQVADEFAPELVLLDIGLAGMSGHDVARALRSRAGGAELTIVALTGWGQVDDLARSRDAGFDHHLVKPVGLEALRELIGDGIAAAPTAT